MLTEVPMPVMITVAIVVILGVLWMTGTFSTRKQYRNRNAFSLAGDIQKNLTALNVEQIENQASSKFHFDDRITSAVLDNGDRLDSLYTEKAYRGPYGVSTRSAINKDEPVAVKVKDVDPAAVVEVDSSQVKPGQNVDVKKENVVATEDVVVKAKDVKPGERVTVKPDQVKSREQVLKKSMVTGQSELVSKEDVDINETVIADSSQVDPETTVVVKAAQVKPNKTVVAQGKSLSAGKKVTVVAEKVKPEEVVVVKTSDTKPMAKVTQVTPASGPSQLAVPAAGDGIELEAPEPISIGTVETRLAGGAGFGKVYSMNKYPAKKAYTTVSARQSLSEFPVRSTVHTSRI
tara:strand:- start:13389 stop:14429 length:1041 start_codon:yes stop_codon:yes gene_type:complete